MVGKPLHRSSSEALLQECVEIEEELVALKVAYEQYFMGLERLPPAKAHEALKKRVNAMRASLKGSTAAKFRSQQLVGKFQTYERLWEKTVKEMEAGIYRRDIFRLRRKQGGATGTTKKDALDSVDIPTDFDVDEDLDSAMAEAVASVSKPKPPAVAPSVAPGVPALTPVAPGVAPLVRGAVPPVAPTVRVAVPPTPAGGTVRPPGTGLPTVAPLQQRGPAHTPAPIAASAASRAPGGGSRNNTGALDEGKLRAVYNAYVTAKKQCREDVSGINYDSVADSLRKQVPELMKKHGANSVDFKVVIKDGKATLRAVPK